MPDRKPSLKQQVSAYSSPLTIAALALFSIWLYWTALGAWFQQDDFAWLTILGRPLRTAADWRTALLAPMAQGTVRPLSERLPFMVLPRVFGLQAFPFHLVTLVTELASVTLLSVIAVRLTGLRLAGLFAGLMWCSHNALAVPMTWASAYNQILSSLAILAAFYCLLQYVETGRTRYYWFQVTAFILGLGASEWSVVYVGLALLYMLCCARRFVSASYPLIGIGALYTLWHFRVAPPATGAYRMHLGVSLLSTLFIYAKMALQPAIACGLILALILLMRARGKHPAAFICLGWFVAGIIPALPLADHIMPYYLTIPVMGLAILAGWGVAEAFHRGTPVGFGSACLGIICVGWNAYSTHGAVTWWTERSLAAERFTHAVLASSRNAPGKTPVLDGITADLYWAALHDGALPLFGIPHFYFAPGFIRNGDAVATAARGLILSPFATWREAAEGRIIVLHYDGGSAQDVTASFANNRIELEPRLPGEYDDLDWSIGFEGAWTRDVQFLQSFAGSLTYSDRSGDSFTFPFEGRTVTWVYTAARNRGKASVMLDNREQGPVDLYSRETRWQQKFRFSAASAGRHDLCVRVLSDKSPMSEGTAVDVDALIVE